MGLPLLDRAKLSGSLAVLATASVQVATGATRAQISGERFDRLVALEAVRHAKEALDEIEGELRVDEAEAA